MSDVNANPDPPPQPPAWPGDDACCGNGCDPCVFDLFDAERERYRVALRQWQARQDAMVADRRPPPAAR